MKKNIILLIVAALVLVGFGVGGAEAARKITGKQIKNNSVTTKDIRDDTIKSRDLRPGLEAKIKAGHRGSKHDDGLTDVVADGPYPGATQIEHGSNSTEKWAGDGGTELQRSWVACDRGQVAVGGGFSRADEGVAAYRDLQIVTSSPALVIDGEVVSLTAAIEEHIVNSDWAYEPNAWLVEGFNNGSTEMIVRPHITCASK